MDSRRRARSPSSSSLGADCKRGPGALPSRKVCIVCENTSTTRDYYTIFIIDLDSEGHDFKFTPRDPTLRLNQEDFPTLEAFCVIGSTLFLFEGYDTATKYHGKSVYTCELPSSDVANLKVERSMLKEAREMHHTKDSPIAVPTPDGKILVFSAVVKFFSACETSADTCNFELYDPAFGSWRELPEIPREWADDWPYFHCWMQAFSFVDGKSVLMLQTEIGILTLDLQSERWGRLDNFHGATEVPHYCGSFLVIGDDLCLNASCAYDIDEKEDVDDALSRSFCFPDSSSFGPEFNFETGAVNLIDDANSRDYKFCTVQTGIKKDTKLPHVIIDLYSFDLVKCREVLMKWREEDRLQEMENEDELPFSTLVKSIKFHLKRKCYRFHRLYCFPIPAGAGVV